MVENEQDQSPTAGISRNGKVLRDFKADLIRVGTGTTVGLRGGNGSAVGDKFGMGRGFESAFRPNKRLYQIVEALTRKPELHVADILSVAANDNFFFVVGEA